MIVKSMARKAPTFAQLIAYISRDAEAGAPIFARNLHHDGADAALTAEGFLANHRYLPGRKNGNALYHEVIVLEPQDHLPQGRVSAILLDLAERYCASRCPDQLAWGRIHTDTANPHIHLMLSANAARSPRRVRLARQAFAQVQKDLEAYKHSRFPELVGHRLYDRPTQARGTPSRSRAEGEVVRRTGRPSQKQLLADRLRALFDQAPSRSALEAALSREGFALYQRGQGHGVRDQASGRKHRLRALGLEEAFARILAGRARSDETSAGDRRAATLLARRDALEQVARAHLDGFEREALQR